MMSEENNSEWIDRYLSGQLDENAKGLLEEKLNTDEEFRMEVELQRSLKQQLRLYNRMELKKKLEDLSVPEGFIDPSPHATHADDQHLAHTNVENRWVWWVAASVLVLGISYGFWQFFTKPPTTSPIVVYRLPVIESDRSGMGFGQPLTGLDSLPVQLITTRGKSPTYEFSDTLKLYLPQISYPSKQWQINYFPDAQVYWLKTDTATFRIERGFAYPRLMQRVR